MVELQVKESAYEESQRLLAASREELNSAMESLQVPVRITTQEEGKEMIRAGLQAVKSLEIVRRQFQEWKERYAHVVTALEVADRAVLEDKIKNATRLAQFKEEELHHLDEYVEGARILWKRFTL